MSFLSSKVASLLLFVTVLLSSTTNTNNNKNNKLIVVNAQSSFRDPYLTPEGERRDQTFQVLEFENGLINQKFDGILRYYCTFRGKWSKERHPQDFPRSPSFSAPVLLSHSNGYRMWTGTETATLGVESIAEEGFATIITNEFNNAGFETLQMVLGERQFNTTDSQHMPPINVTFEHQFLSSMVKLTPSPDWFAGFSDFRVISPTTETYYNRVVIRSYIWDCGTDAGQTYTALDRDEDPQRTITQYTVDNVPPKGQFLDPLGEIIPIPVEYECVLRVGDGDYYPGKPFNETEDIRPPLNMPRDDDFVDGECCRWKFDGKPNPAASSAFSSFLSSCKMLAIVAITTTSIVVSTVV